MLDSAFFEDRLAPAGAPAAWRFRSVQEILTAHDAPSLAQALARLAACPAWWVVALDYELAYLFEAKAAPAGWQPHATRPLARFFRYAECDVGTAEQADAWLSADAEAASAVEGGVGGMQAALSEADYCAAVERIQEWIAAGDCYQVNYTWPLEFTWFGSPLAIYRRLRAAQPVRYGALLTAADGTATVSLSPELFLERRGARLLTRPMKGTAPRDRPAESLRESVKDRAENLMIVDLLRNDLGRIAQTGTVRVERLFDIEAYPSVWQMVSEISAAAPEADFGTVLRALFPCGSITGAPKVRSMQIIGELEPTARGIYTGALGWLAPNGDFRLNVAIRTLALAADGRGRLHVGSGIVADSVAADEWQECLLKAAFLCRSDPGLQLIETLRLEEGRIALLERHLERLARSAAWFAFPFDAAALRNALAALPGEGLWRLRLTLDKQGQVGLVHVPLAAEPAGERWAVWASDRIQSGDPLRGHKTTARQAYDRALAEIAGTPTVFDVLFLNERGEVAEGARSNLFVERDGVLLTPPLASGALPGVLRAELLANGRAREAVLYPDDLAAGFYLGNALRGLIPVRLKESA